MDNTTNGYYNYTTGQVDFLSDSPKDWSPYIPQSEQAQNLYKLYMLTGDSAIRAAIKVLELHVTQPINN